MYCTTLGNSHVVRSITTYRRTPTIVLTSFLLFFVFLPKAIHPIYQTSSVRWKSQSALRYTQTVLTVSQLCSCGWL